jgi:hypothetical protein
MKVAILVALMPNREPGAILTRVREWLLVCVAHVETLTVLDGSMQQHAAGPILMDDKFSGVLLERKEEMMIVNSSGDQNYALAVKGGGLCGKSGQGSSINAGG